MPWPCQREGCTFSDTGVCARAAEFESPETECEDYLASSPSDIPEPDLQRETGFPPWTGDALGTEFSSHMDLSNRPIRVLVVGAPGSGKTTLLTGQFLDLDRTPHTGLPAQFAGSYTLRGYDRLCDAAFGWTTGVPARIPHSGRGSARDPAWLHLAFRYSPDGAVKHLLLSDLPGEVFTQWCKRADAIDPNFLSQIDVFWLVVDAGDVSLKDKRAEACYLLSRIRAAAIGKRVEVILSKVDKSIDGNLSLEHALAAADLLVADLRAAWDSESDLSVTPVAAFPDEEPTRAGWQTLEPLRNLLIVRAQPSVPRHCDSTRYVDYMGMR